MKFPTILNAIPSLLIFSTISAADLEKKPTLCSPQEKNSISFETQSRNKIASICEGPDDSYIVYRFGRPGNIELSFPKKLGKDSWRQFTFSGYQRRGGAANDGMGDYTLSFTSGKNTYSIVQNWREINKNYYIGILVEMSGRHIDIKGLQSSQTGSLVLLENKNLLPNQDDDQ